MLASYAFDEASKSPCLMKHGCVATMNGKIIGRGHNNIGRIRAIKSFTRCAVVMQKSTQFVTLTMPCVLM